MPAKAKFVALLVVAVMAGLLPTVIAQSPQPTHSLTWADAPSPYPVRHFGDAEVRWGWETVDKALGPFFQQPFQVGDHTMFSIVSSETPKEFELLYRSEKAYFWFEVGYQIDPDILVAAGERFDHEIWELDRYLYGENATPGIDGDTRIHLVHLASLTPGLAGFFSPTDQCAQHICLGSNERDALYLILDYGPVGSDLYYSTIAHEFQHMIQYSIDGNEARWLNEGLSQLAEHLNGFGDDPINNTNLDNYRNNPNFRLDGWSSLYDQSLYYGGSNLFTVYLYERFGVETIRELARNPLDGLASVYDVLRRTQHIDLNDFTTDWWIANTLDNPAVGDGRYAYKTFDFSTPIKTTPLTGNQHLGMVQQYGAEYLTFNQSGSYTLHFVGDSQTPIMPTQPHSGDWMWWSYNAAASATSLTRSVDLTGVSQATLKYWLYGETGRFPGYLHVLASTDGQHWEILQGANMDIFNRHSEAPGPHYAGQINEWRADFIDLSEYAGQVVQIRFEYVTSNSVTGYGFVLDDISIPDIGWSDDAENGANGWDVDGFLRIPETVQQEWAVVILTHESTPQVVKIPVVNGEAIAQVDIPAGGATFIVGAMAPFTPLEAQYQLTLN
ncbi:MAG: immune inhibitor A [Anaerolineales bacterium]|nr:immune inhibitor A [Anaerolineales bacterium]